MKKQHWNAVIFILGILIILAAVYIIQLDNSTELSVNSFEECVAAGFPISESSPRKCSAYGRDFVEETSPGNYCTEESRNAEACTAIYAPVCGWNDPDKVQCIKYPCAQTYSNSCMACMNENVEYWTASECPA